ncbi:hypothetical protein RIF29_18594 [Crotalaria pallida]|uniref:Ferredoxin thioredoxin reductase alpha chain domain-containing protein n=1 Tax=Crotalaria pallida TaxID=3830 RepID=A0AAN9I5N9_CROPI
MNEGSMSMMSMMSISATTRLNWMTPLPLPLIKTIPNPIGRFRIRNRSTRIRSEVAAVEAAAASTSSSSEEAEAEAVDAGGKVGARVKVKKDLGLKVYHIPKVEEFDLAGLEGQIKQYVGVWKGKRISANLPFKVEFLTHVPGRAAPLKFFAHLKEDEFDYL